MRVESWDQTEKVGISLEDNQLTYASVLIVITKNKSSKRWNMNAMNHLECHAVFQNKKMYILNQ